MISTGTWSISLNPFNNELLSDEALKNDCLNFMRIDGKPVKAARLFLGEEYKAQAIALEKYFRKDKGAHRQVEFNKLLYQKVAKVEQAHFAFNYLKTPWQQPKKSQLNQFKNFEEAYHHLMWELVKLQIDAVNLAIGNTPVQKIYIDGGFADNRVFVQMIAHYFKQVKLRTTQSPLGSALGAAMVISDEKVGKKFLKKNYALKKHKREKQL